MAELDLRVNSQLTRRDLFWYQLIMFPRLKANYITMFVLSLGALTYLVWKLGFPEGVVEGISFLIVSIGAGIFGIIVGLFVCLVNSALFVNKNSSYMQPFNYVVSEKGLNSISDTSEGTSSWAAFSKLIETRSYFLCQLKGGMCYIMPKRSFQSFDSERKFIEFSKQHWQDAQLGHKND